MGGWNGGGFGWKGGLVEGEEDCAKERRRLLARIGFELRLGVDDECRADSRE